MIHEMTLYGFSLDLTAKAPVALLKDHDNDISMPVMLRLPEAVALASAMLTKEASDRCGGDFLVILLDRLGARLERIGLDCLPDGRLGGIVTALHGETEFQIEAQPHEVLTLSLRFELPILVTSEAIAAAAVAELAAEDGVQGSESEKLLGFLEQLDPADMGKYPM